MGKEMVGVAFGTVCLVLVALRLCGVVSWSWVWILSPMWIYVGVSGVLLLYVFSRIIVKAVKMLLDS